ncbi:MAG: hypothetical protein ACREAJ_02110 [Nitrosopumilaceae archaeon]
MNELEIIKGLTPEFQLTILQNVSRVEQYITEILSIDAAKKPEDIYQRASFFKHFDEYMLSRKIKSLKIIMQNNYPEVLEQFPNFLPELMVVKRMRDSIAHSTIAYERDSNEADMQEFMTKAKKLTEDIKKILSLIGKSNGLRF